MPQSKEDEHLIRQITSEEEHLINSATAVLCKRGWYVVAKFVRMGGGTDEDVQSILNDSIIALINIIQKGAYDPEKAKWSTLLRGIAQKKWMDELKSRYQRKNRFTTIDENTSSSIHNEQNPIEEYMFSKEEREKIVWALKQLDPACRELFQMKYMQGISLRIIAKKLNISEDAVKKRHERCKKKLRSLFDQDPRIS